MDDSGDFERFERRLGMLDKDVRCTALEYASQIFAQQEVSREEALEKGISRAELEKRIRNS